MLLITVLITLVLTLLAVWLVLNVSLANKPFDQRFDHLYSVEDKQFVRAMGVLLGAPQEPGNCVQDLLNGNEIFPAMLQAISSAKQTITLETYIFFSGTIGNQFADALIERAESKVKVHVLVDWFGSELEKPLLNRMAKKGVEIRRYNAPHWYNLQRLNHRTHRRLMVIDGKVGFVGGVGIGAKWCGSGATPQHWRDSHFRVEEPVVARIQAAFVDNWMHAFGELLHGERYFPDLDGAGTQMAQVFTGAPGRGAKNMQLMFLFALAAAAKSIHISAAYFVPDEAAANTLIAAINRGVKVRIIVPGPHIDRPLARYASRSLWGNLLRAGAEIYEYQPAMFHVKVMIIDGLWVSVGSTNFDTRSFSINDEVNMNVYDAGFARRQIAIFEEDAKQSRRITLQEWESRPWQEKMRDRAAALFSSQM